MFDDTDAIRPVGRSFYATLISFPNACFVLAFLTDATYALSLSVLWETASVWLLALGLVVGAIAVLAGIVDLVRSRRIRIPPQPWLAVVGEFVALLLALVNVFVHSRDGYTAVVPEGIGLSLLTVLVLIATLFVGRNNRRARARNARGRYA